MKKLKFTSYDKSKDFNVFYNKVYLRIDDSYILADKDVYASVCILRNLLEDKGYEYKRSYKSWTIEWIAHNRLYKMGLFRIHTKDVDIDENESLLRRFIYHIISLDYTIVLGLLKA